MNSARYFVYRCDGNTDTDEVESDPIGYKPIPRANSVIVRKRSFWTVFFVEVEATESNHAPHPFPGYFLLNRKQNVLIKLQLAKARSENRMLNDEQEAERFRTEKSRLDLQLEVLGKDDPKRHLLVRQREGAIYEIRAWMVRSSVDLCFVHDCVDVGSDRTKGKQWCQRHKPWEHRNELRNWRGTKSTD